MIHLDDFLQATGAQAVGPIFAREYDDFCYDSRLLEPGQLFLAVKTDKGDGHDYIAEAARLGAAGVVCQRPVDLAGEGVTVIQVVDTPQALLDWAAFILRRYGTEVIGVTGSTGKTSTKEAIAQVLATRFPVFRNFANYNGRYGLPIALGRLDNEHRVAVLEMACDAFDEIRLLAELTRPHIGVVTSINQAHLAYFGSLATIAQEKGQLIRALPSDGTAILNYDDPWIRAMIQLTRGRPITFGLDPTADIVAEDVRPSRHGSSMRIRAGDKLLSVTIQLIGRHTGYIATAALAAALAYDIPLAEAADALSTLAPIAGRLAPIEGLRGAMILDDTYNSSPASALAALDALADLPARRRLAVLGYMSDLGEFEEQGQRLVGRRAAQVADILIVKGEEARALADEAESAGLPKTRIMVANTDEDILRSLTEHVADVPPGHRSDAIPGDVILVKGSPEARLESVVKGLMAHPERASEQLVRQNRAWQTMRLLRPGRPTWVEVDLEAVAGNIRQVAALVGPGVRIMAVLKADGYGHGAVRVARTALSHGASYLGVACVGEATVLREAGIEVPILVLGYTPAWQARELILARAAGAVFTYDVALAFSRAAQELHRPLTVHVKIDTGMGRLGFLPDEVLPFVQEIQSLPGLNVEGIFTHFSVSDWADKAYTRRQVSEFRRVLDGLASHGIRLPLVHAANSAAALTLPESHFNMVRLGIALYGLAPSPETPLPAGFRPALTFKTQIAQVKELPSGSYVSYGNTYQTVGRQRIAVIPVGYADGFRRAPAHWGSVLVRGRRAPIVGRVCMDQTMLDVSAIPDVQQGDEVILIGRQGLEEITVDEVAQQLGTINYEVVSEILARVPRIT